jgi:hypothetical protein
LEVTEVRDGVQFISARYKPRAEEYRLHNDICLFDPSPMT